MKVWPSTDRHQLRNNFAALGCAAVFGMPLALFPAIAARHFGDAHLVGYLYSAPAAGALPSASMARTAAALKRDMASLSLTARGPRPSRS